MLSEKIDAIVAKRNAVAGGFEDKIKEATRWKTYVDNLLIFYEEKKGNWHLVLEDSKSLEQGLELKKSLIAFKEKVEKLLGKNEDGKSLKAASKRANRGYVNLGIIGPWRIGKSQIVQQLTRLDTWIIPTDAGDNCTACPINVINGNYKGESNVAVISIYSVEEMCDTINKYIEHCKLNNYVEKLTAKTQNEFLSQCLSRKNALSNIPSTSLPDGTEKGFYDKMKEYLDNASEYYEMLNDGSNNLSDYLSSISDNYELKDNGTEVVLSGINKDEIKSLYRPHVSYYARPNASQQSFKCLASKGVTIYVEFRFLDENIGKLRLLDTPGIGECKLNVSEGLSKALRYDLDIAVATALARPNHNDKQQILDFHDILKKETTGRHPENWLYYMYNVYSTYPGMNSSLLKTRHKFIEDDLADKVRGGEGIVLPSSHYADIDALVNKGIECPEEDGVNLENCRVDTINLSTFYNTILVEMVDSIAKVDKVFYDNAEKTYNEIEKDFQNLLESIAKLPVVNYDNQVIELINQQMTTLYDALRKLKLDLKLYSKDGTSVDSSTKTLSQKIQDYCAEKNYGSTLFSILGITENLNNSSFDKYFKGIERQLSQAITEDNWNENQDFDEYVKLKRNLIKQIEMDVLSQYDKELAEKNLKAEKRKILDIYYKDGKFCEIVGESIESWSEILIKKLQEDTQYEDLKSIFEQFIAYELNIEQELKKTIKTLRMLNQHRDQFIYDSDDYMPFDRYEKALKAFGYSLYNLEIAIKKALSGRGENSYETMILTQEGEFKTAMSPIKTIPAANVSGYTSAGTQLMKLYMAHGDIFKDDQAAAKNAVAIDWKKKIVYNKD